MAATILEFENLLDTDTLKEKLKQDMPDCVVKGIPLESGFQVRKSNFTTQNIAVKPNKNKGQIKVTNSMDFLIVYILLVWPLALYIYMNRDKHEQLKQEVIDKLNEYHTS